MAPKTWIESLQENDPQLAQLVASDREFVAAGEAIPAKYKTLMSMMADALLGHGDGVRAIAQRARRMGVSEDEIRECVRLVYQFGGVPALITALNAFEAGG